MDYYTKYIKYKNKYILEKKRLLMKGGNMLLLNILEKEFKEKKNNIEKLFDGRLDELKEKIEREALKAAPAAPQAPAEAEAEAEAKAKADAQAPAEAKAKAKAEAEAKANALTQAVEAERQRQKAERQRQKEARENAKAAAAAAAEAKAKAEAEQARQQQQLEKNDYSKIKNLIKKIYVDYGEHGLFVDLLNKVNDIDFKNNLSDKTKLLVEYFIKDTNEWIDDFNRFLDNMVEYINKNLSKIKQILEENDKDFKHIISRVNILHDFPKNIKSNSNIKKLQNNLETRLTEMVKKYNSEKKKVKEQLQAGPAADGKASVVGISKKAQQLQAGPAADGKASVVGISKKAQQLQAGPAADGKAPVVGISKKAQQPSAEPPARVPTPPDRKKRTKLFSPAELSEGKNKLKKTIKKEKKVSQQSLIGDLRGKLANLRSATQGDSDDDEDEDFEGGAGTPNIFGQLLKDVTKFTSKKNKIKIIKLLKAVVKKLKQKLNINMMMFPFFGFMGGNKDLDKMTDTELNNKGMKLIDEIKDIAIKYKNIIDKFPWFKKILNMF